MLHGASPKNEATMARESKGKIMKTDIDLSSAEAGFQDTPPPRASFGSDGSWQHSPYFSF
jgi:hypothetical protein